MATERVSESFETGFLSKPLSKQIETCGKYELLPLFMELLPMHQPVLEAGCGSGKWMHFFKQCGIESVGIDWSSGLQEMSRAYDASIRFDTGDLRDLPYEDASFGSIIALGSPEHVLEGPGRVFTEFYRVLKPNGIAIITVPFYSPVRRFVFSTVRGPLWRLKRNRLLRRVCGKPPANAANVVPPKQMRMRRFRPDIYLQLDFDGYFYQYHFTRKQYREELEKSGFRVERLFVFGHTLGLILNFGRLSGFFDKEACEVKLTPIGKVLSKLLGADLTGHMHCAVVRKPQ